MDMDLSTLSPAELRTLRGRCASRLRRTKAGGRAGGRKPIPTACRCGVLCASVRLARDHCRKPIKTKEI